MTYRAGENHKDAKLTEADVMAIRELNAERERLRKEANKLSIKAIAEKFDIHEGHVKRIIRGECWTHI